MKKIRIISAIMSVIMIIGVLVSASVFPAFAVDGESSGVKKEKNRDYYNTNYFTKVFSTPELKIATMKKYLENDKYIFYVQTESGEWALANKLTGQYLFSNPYDLGATEASDSTKMDLLSQVMITYNDGGVSKTYTSFKDCVMYDQIKVKNLKNGVRVEYTIGNEESRKLIPMQITAERFETQILSKIPEGRQKEQFKTYFQLKSLNDKTLTTAGKKQLIASYPIVEKYDIYVFDIDAGNNEMIRQETVIKTYCPEYTFEELEYDHELVGYVATNKAPAVFKFALEYTLDENGVDARLGANGIRFDETMYKLEDMKILPFVGAGSSSNKGYLFIPDGSGAIIRFEDVLSKQVTITGKLYGQDYAFHTITGSTQQIMRLPVYGIVETGTRTVHGDGDDFTSVDVNRGFLAIIEEGDSLSTIYAETGGTLHKYNTVYSAFNPRPSDQYNLADSISIGSNATWTVVSDRKYTGSYRIKYIMLEDELLSQEAAKSAKGEYTSYDADYVGMAKAYREYLYKTGQLTQLTDKDVSENIPLYIESFGTIDTTKKVLSFPITVETPLTTFDDLMKMYSDLEAEGIDNVNFKLTGFTNGGMISTVPSKVDFQSKVGGNSGFKEFLKYAEEKGIGVYPEFDFVYLKDTGAFDGFSYKRDAVRTIDNRYTQKQKYDSVYQTLTLTGNVVISVSAFSEFYEGFNKDMQKFGAKSVSVSTLTSDLNSDFDEDNPYNREDARYETLRLLEDLNKDYGSVMGDAGNAYTFKYVDQLLNVSIDSSRYTSSSQSIPFTGMVLHGAIEFAGTPLNTTGNISYEILRMIENGANPYFLLSYQNTAKLKDNKLYSDYFSVQYGIWKEDLIKYYKEINSVLNDVQTALIVDHEFVQGERVPTEEEIKDDEKTIKEAEEKASVNKSHDAEKERRAAILAAKEEAWEKLKENNNGQTAQTATNETAANETTTEENTEAENNEAVVEEEEESLVDVKTKYLTQLGTVVKVTYDNGKAFILNYNNFDIKVDGQLISAFGYYETTASAES